MLWDGDVSRTTYYIHAKEAFLCFVVRFKPRVATHVSCGGLWYLLVGVIDDVVLHRLAYVLLARVVVACG